jgi:two-component system, response regulator YesN
LHCSERITNQKEIPSLYDSFVKMIGTEDSARKDRLEAEAVAVTIPAASGHRVKELQTQLTGAILLGNPDRLVQKVNELAEKNDALPLEDAKMEALALAFAMHQVTKQQLEYAEKSPYLADQIERLQRLSTEKAVKEWTKEQSGRFLVLYDAWRLHNQEGIIRRSLEFLDKHYMEECTLTDLANRVHVTPAYFSKLFKKETGDNYSTYLTKLRMQKAVLLLGHSDMKVFEIASSVGYDDPNYFTNVFRMLYKMSPSDYRKQLKS